MQIEVIKKRTKSFRLSVNKDCKVRLTAPLYATKLEINSFISKNQSWLENALSKMQAKKEELDKKRGEFEGKALYLGKTYNLQYLEKAKTTTIENDTIQTKNEKSYKAWLKSEAIRIFTPKCYEIASFYGVEIKSIGVRFMKSRWGSCSISGNISLNINLVKAPRSVIEYVIIHEIAHRKEHNHSIKFWNEVKKLCPEYKTSELWLKQNGFILV